MFSTSEFPDHIPATFSNSGLLEALPTVLTTEAHQTAAGICQQSEFVNCSYSSGGCGSPSSLPSLIKRSLGSHSLPVSDDTNNKIGVVSYPPVWHHGTDQLMNLIDSSPFRQVFSTGNLQTHRHQQKLSRSESPLSHESSSSIIEGMLSKACRYSAEEKKKRIERYKSKRTQRNFSKKIKYACRKTLADSRPRIRGRFARNENNEEENVDQDYDQRLYYGCGQVVEWGNRVEYQEGDQLGDYGNDDHWVSLLNRLQSS